MELKKGVNPIGLRPELLLALIVADQIWKENGFHFVVTSLNDSKHSRTSLHFDGKAADLRIWDIPSPKLKEMTKELHKRLGDNPDYDIIIEKDHVHMEYQPKYRET